MTDLVVVASAVAWRALDYDLIWLLENPRKFYVDRYKLSLDEDMYEC
jgi:hypothetical protein